MSHDQHLDQPAELGSILPPTVLCLDVLLRFYDARARHLSDLIGIEYGRDPVVEAILLDVLDRFKSGVLPKMFDLETQVRFGSRASVIRRVNGLEDRRVLARRRHHADRRVIELWPTARLVHFYNTNLVAAAMDALEPLDALRSLQPK